MERLVDVLQQAERGELQDCHRRQTYTSHQHVPSSLHTRALTGLIGGPGTILGPVPHRVRGPQCLHRPSPELSQLVDHGFADGVQAGGPPSSLMTVLVVPPYEDMFAGATRHIVEGKL